MFSSLRARLTGLVGPAHLKLGLRASVAALASYALAVGLSLPNGYWAVLTAILVVQSTIGASLSVAIDRSLGTMVGGVIGVAAAMLAGPSMPLTFLLMTVAVFLTSTLAARSASYKLAPVTVVIVLLSDPSHAEPWLSGLHRVFEIVVGGAVGVLCALVVLPARALVLLFPHCASAVRVCAGLLARGRNGLLGRGIDPAEIDALNGKARKALRAADARIIEARAERAFADAADPAPVVRGCRRLWHSVIILLRGAGQPLTEGLAGQVAPSLDGAIAALGDFMTALAARLDGDRSVDLATPSATAHAAVAALEAMAEQLNAAGVLDTLRGADLTTLFAAISACTHVRENLDEIVVRLAEMEGQPA